MSSVMRAVFGASVAAYVVTWLVAWAVLPERVPMHFGLAGEVDRWGSRTEALVTMGVLGAAMALLFWGMAVWVPRAPETLLNINAKDKRWWLATEERERELRRRLSEDLYAIGAATMLLLVVVEASTIAAARDAEPSLQPWVIVAAVVYLVGIVAYCVHLALRRYRTPRDVP